MSSRSNGVPDARARLLAGVCKFQQTVYPERKADYQRLIREGQNPHTLFIACSDSRVDPELLTQSGPGEIFVSRNIGNLVPPYGRAIGGISALVEYAVAALQVQQVVICGHTDCGAMKALLAPEQVAAMPSVQLWLRNGEPALERVRARHPPEENSAPLEELIEENVLVQIEHLRTHPSVAAKLAQSSLTIAGWVYNIAQGAVRIFDEQSGRFISVDNSDSPSLMTGTGA